MNISEMVARNARMFPDTVALIEREPNKKRRMQITWKQFDERVNRIANGLIARGIGKGDRVAHWMMNSINWLEAYVAIIRTGALAVPLNFRFTSQDFKYCMDVAEPKAVIFDEQFSDYVKPIRDKFFPMNNYIVVGENAPPNMVHFEDLIAESSSQPVEIEISDEDPCGIYFTSGTTGPPKPILLIHKNMECSAITEVAHGWRKPGDIFILLKPLYHLGEMTHWLGSLILGGCAVIQRGKISPKIILEAIHEERGTFLMLLVPWVQDILTALDTGEIKREEYDLSCWRLVLFGAQPVPVLLVLRFKEKFPHVEYEVIYGLSETSGPGCTHLPVGNDHKLGSIGKAGFNWEVRVVNDKGEDLNVEEVGEIIVKGNGVMKEYYKNLQKTAETIRKGWLYTGDMGRVDRDGFLWLVDRKKDVIICGGENIYPVEVEGVLQKHPIILDVGVIGLPDERLGEIVGAVIKLKPGIEESMEIEKEIYQFCEEHLPRYKRPRQIIFDDVPRNPTGKIEKRMMREKYFNLGKKVRPGSASQ